MPLLCLQAADTSTASALPDTDRDNEVEDVHETAGQRLRSSMLAFVRDIVLLYRLLRHKSTPWHARGVLFVPVLYLCSPIQLIPNFIPIIGQLDDVFMIWLAKRIARKLIDDKTWQECEDAALATEQRLRMARRL